MSRAARPLPAAELLRLAALLLAIVAASLVLLPGSDSADAQTAAPTVTAVEVTSDAGSDSTYALGETITVTLTFTQAVNVSGSPRLQIDMDPADWGTKNVPYESGSGTASLTFAHTVVEPNYSTQGIAVLENSLALNGGTIRSVSGVNATLTHTGLAHDADHKVNWQLAPTPTPRQAPSPRASGNQAPTLPTGCTAFDSPTSNLIKTVTSTATTVTVTFGSATNRDGGGILSICGPGGSGTYSTRDAQTWEFTEAPLVNDTFEITGLTAATDYWVQYSVFADDSAWYYIRTIAAPPTITIAAGTSPVTEGTAATFTVTASPAPSANLTVNLTVADASGSDFVAAADEGSKTVTINASSTSATYSVTTQGDTTDEPDGDVTVTVAAGTGYSVGATASANVTVHDLDKTPPTLLGGTIDGSTVRLYFSEPMDTAASLVAAQFTVTSSPPLGAVSSPTWSASELNILTLTTATAANTAQSVTISISATAGVQDAAGNDLAAVDAFSLTNIGASAPGAPTLSTAEVDGDTLTLTYNQRLLPRYPLPGDFTVYAPGTTTTVSSLAINPGDSTSTVVLTLSTPVKSTDTVTVSYSKGSVAPGLQNEWGEEVAALSDRTVTTPPPPPARIWSSWLTVFVRHVAGCQTPAPNADPSGLPPLDWEYEFACRRLLTDYSFMHEGMPYEFTWVGRQGPAGGDEHLVVAFNPFDNGTIPIPSQEWTLHVDNRQFPVADSSREVENLEGFNVWTNPGFDWTAGQKVWLCLTTGGASCAKPATPVIPPPDNTAPAFSSAVVDRATLTVTFNEALDENSGSPDRSAFFVTVAGSRRNIASDEVDSKGDVVFHGVAIDGKTVTLTLESAVAGGQVVTLAYSRPTTQGGSPLRDTLFNNVAGFSGTSVTNKTKPWLPEVLVRGVKLTLIFDQEVDHSSVPASGDFQVKVNGQVQGLADPVAADPTADPPVEAVVPVAVRDSRVILTLEAQAAVGAGDRVTLSYPAKPTGATTPILGADGTEAASFKDRSVRNLASDRTSPTLRSATVQGATLTLVYSELLDPDFLPLEAEFQVQVGAERISVSAVALSGRRVVLTLDRSVLVSEEVQLAYSGGSIVDYIADYAGNRAARIPLRSVTHGPPPASTRPPSGGGFVGGGGGGGPSGPSPSAVDFEWNVKRDIEALDGGHDNPTGLWGDGETLLLLENGSGADDAVYAYDLESGKRVEEREFELDRLNRAPRGIWADAQGVAWVSDSGRNKLFAYDLASGERLEDRDIDLDKRNAAARGIWSDSEAMWVLDGRRDALFAYDLETGEALAEYRLHAANDDPHDLWSDGVTIWVSNHDPKRLFAYRLPELPGEGEAPPEEPQELERVRDEEFDKLSRASNNSPRGIWSDGEVMYVADALDGRVYSYNMPDAIDARLASLTLAGVEIGEFSPARTEYEGGAGTGAGEATVEAVPAQDGASVVINPPDADGEGGNGHQVTLEGLAEITVTVTSEDDSRTRVYRVALAAPEEQPWAHSLKGAVAEGFSLLVYEGGSVEELAAAAESRSIAALYVLHEGRYVAYVPEAPDFVNRAFAALYADGVPALTPLVAASEGPPSADPVGELAAPGGWPACLHGEVGAGWSLVLHEGGSVEELAACAESRGVTALYALHEGEWVSFFPAAPDFVNRAFAELYADGVPSLTPLVVRASGGAQSDGEDDGTGN